ncbi:hypothetical protein GCM10009578_065620 [Streptomyces rhizosphaericus]
MSQRELAREIGASERWIRRCEDGESVPSYDILAKIADKICAEPQRRTYLYTLAGYHGAPPESHHSDKKGYAQYLDAYTEQVREAPHAAYARDSAWNVVAANPAFGEMVSEATGERSPIGWNIFLYVTLHPDARERLADWHNRWRMPMLCQFTRALRLNPEHPQLRRLHRQITADPETRRAYQQVPFYMHSAESIVHFDGAALPLLRGARHLRIKVCQPLAWQPWGIHEVELRLED